jgi:6-phosphogluconolactonase (cycloisomerase 2 family)
VTNYGDATLSAYRVDGSTGALTEIDGSRNATEPNPNDVVVDPTNATSTGARDGTKLTATASGRAEPDPAARSPFAAVPAGFGDFTSAAVDHSGRFLYATDALNEKIRGLRSRPRDRRAALMSDPASPSATTGMR